MAKQYYDNNMKISDCDEVINQTKNIINSKNSAIQFFLDNLERTESSQDRILKTELYRLYNTYCIENGFDNIGRNKFYSTLLETYNLDVIRDRQFTNIKYNRDDPLDLVTFECNQV